MHGHASHIDKCCPLTRVTPTQTPTHKFSLQLSRAQAIATSVIMSSHSQTTNDQSSDIILSPAPPVDIFELNQARRAKVTKELEALRSGTLLFFPNVFESGICEISLIHSLQRSWSGQPSRDWKHLPRRRTSTVR